MTRESRGPNRPPQTGNPKATGGLGVAGEGGHFLNSAPLPSHRRITENQSEVLLGPQEKDSLLASGDFYSIFPLLSFEEAEVFTAFSPMVNAG